MNGVLHEFQDTRQDFGCIGVYDDGCHRVQVGGFQVDYDELSAAAQGEQWDFRGRGDFQGRTDDDHDIAFTGSILGGQKCLGRELFAEQDDVGFDDSATVRAVGDLAVLQELANDGFGREDLEAVHTGGFTEMSMQFMDDLAARAGVQHVDILGDDSFDSSLRFQRGQSMVSWVGEGMSRDVGDGINPIVEGLGIVSKGKNAGDCQGIGVGPET